MAKIILVESPTPTPPGSSTMLVYARDGSLWTMDSSGNEERVPGLQVANIVPDGTKDGVNDTFTIPGGVSYIAGSLIVFLNGIAYQPTSVTEVGPAYQTFVISGDHLPSADDAFTCSYTEGA